jgi:hypothetical protein
MLSAMARLTVDLALWLDTLFHRVVMWCGLTRRGDTSDGPAGLLRDLDEMSRWAHEEEA